jgi:hypothetical protein
MVININCIYSQKINYYQRKFDIIDSLYNKLINDTNQKKQNILQLWTCFPKEWIEFKSIYFYTEQNKYINDFYKLPNHLEALSVNKEIIGFDNYYIGMINLLISRDTKLDEMESILQTEYMKMIIENPDLFKKILYRYSSVKIENSLYFIFYFNLPFREVPSMFNPLKTSNPEFYNKIQEIIIKILEQNQKKFNY